MKSLVCEMCGNNDLVKQDGVFVCQYCGTKYSVEEARKMMIEGTVEVQGTVKLDQSDAIKNYLQMAKISFESQDMLGVENYLSKSLELDPQNYEVWVYKAKVIGWASSLEEDKIKSAIVAAQKAVSFAPESDKAKVAEDVMQSIVAQNLELLKIAITLNNGYIYIHNLMLQWITIVDSIPYLPVNSIKSQINACKKMCEDSKATASGPNRMVFATYFGYNQREPYDVTFAKKLAPKIRKDDPSYAPPEKSGGCYVATAVYGSYDCPQVWTLRRFRDNILAETWYGRAFIRTYYAISPTLVKWFGQRNWFKSIWRKPLDTLVQKLQADGIESIPYQDKKW